MTRDFLKIPSDATDKQTRADIIGRNFGSTLGTASDKIDTLFVKQLLGSGGVDVTEGKFKAIAYQKLPMLPNNDLVNSPTYVNADYVLTKDTGTSPSPYIVFFQGFTTLKAGYVSIATIFYIYDAQRDSDGESANDPLVTTNIGGAIGRVRANGSFIDPGGVVFRDGNFNNSYGRTSEVKRSVPRYFGVVQLKRGYLLRFKYAPNAVDTGFFAIIGNV